MGPTRAMLLSNETVSGTVVIEGNRQNQRCDTRIFYKARALIKGPRGSSEGWKILHNPYRFPKKKRRQIYKQTKEA